MKGKLFYIGLSVILVTFLFSCNKDFLNRNPLDQISSENFWKNEDEVNSALAACYNWLSTGPEGFGQLTPHWDGLTDDGYCQYPWENGFTTVAEGQIESTSGGIVSSEYFHDYQAIANINYFLANIDNVKMDDNKKNQYKAEVRFLRAYYYFRLSNLYGGVILSLKPETLDSAKRAQNTKEEVTKAVLNDLDFAIANLPDIPYTGHAVKGSALALKTRVLLYNEKWSEAAQTAKIIIDSKVFHLSDNYTGMFDGTDQDNNPEIMFSAKYQNPNMYSSGDLHYGIWLSCAPIANLVQSYECTDGKPITQSPLYNPSDPYKNRDPRLKMTIFVPGEPAKTQQSGIFDPSKNSVIKTGFGWKKYLNMANQPADYSTRSDQDFVILRYADVLLMYAEAQNEAVGPDQSVYDAVNEVRARPGVNMPPLPAGLSQSQMRDAIRLERRVEFAMEGLRYFDLQRWKLLDKIIPTITDPGGIQRKFDQHNYLWPFPQSEIDINPQLKQNPGY